LPPTVRRCRWRRVFDEVFHWPDNARGNGIAVADDSWLE